MVDVQLRRGVGPKYFGQSGGMRARGTPSTTTVGTHAVPLLLIFIYPGKCEEADCIYVCRMPRSTTPATKAHEAGRRDSGCTADTLGEIPLIKPPIVQTPLARLVIV